MNLIICMAGLYRRFKEAGYATPKFLLPWQEKPLLEHIIQHMLAEGAFSTVTLVANKRDAANAEEICLCLDRLGISRAGLVFIADTRGQAETALIGIESMDRQHGKPTDRRVIFHNIDTLLLRRDWHQIAGYLQDYDGFIDTFESNDAAYSFVAIDHEALVTQIREKVVISNQATSGCYGFASADTYKYFAIELIEEIGGEVYISGVYEKMLRAGKSIKVMQAEEADTLIFGTPASYEAHCKSAGP